MSDFHKMSDATALVSGMATRLDIEVQNRSGAVPATRSYADMVSRCATCGHHGACKTLLNENMILDAAPEYCQNRDVFDGKASSV